LERRRALLGLDRHAAIFDYDCVIQPGAGHHPWLDDAAARFVRTTATFLHYPAVSRTVADGEG
jgi:hypothetical protein